MNNLSKNIELLLYFTIWITSVNYSIYNFAKKAYDYFSNYNDEYGDFTEGVWFLSKKRDKSDSEWEEIFFLIHSFYPYVLFYVSISVLIRFFTKNKLIINLWIIIFTFTYIKCKLGFVFFSMLLLQPVGFYVAKFFNRTTKCTWTCAIVSLISINIYKKYEFLNLSEHENYILSVSLCWMNLKCTSFYLERPTSTSFIKFFSYCLHPATLLTGPFILYEDYEYIYYFNQETITERIGKLFKNLLRCLTLFLLGNVCLHFIYVNATSYNISFIQNLDCWSLCGYGYAMGQFFHIKYTVLYGFSTTFASFENINVPNLPRCIGRVHLYSDMWRYFDQGLYKFLLKNIYIPLLKITNLKILTSLISFTFVCVWHGLDDYIVIWSSLNYLGIVIENGLSKLNKPVFDCLTGKFGYVFVNRVKCVLSAPLLAISATSNFYFFGGREVGNIFIKRLFTGSFVDNLTLMSILYCCSQVSTHLRTLNASKM